MEPERAGIGPCCAPGGRFLRAWVRVGQDDKYYYSFSGIAVQFMTTFQGRGAGQARVADFGV